MKRITVLTLTVALVAFAGSGMAATCGDMDMSGNVDISDLVYLVEYMFTGGPPLPYPPTADFYFDSQIDIADLVFFIDYMFGGCPPPVCPFDVITDHSEADAACRDTTLGGAQKETATALSTGDRGTLRVEVIGNDVHVYHDDAYYQCCLEYFVDYNLSGDVITGFEADTGWECDCICWFDLESVIYDLAEGSYTLVLIGIWGDTVGTVQFDIPTNGPEVIDYWDSGCLPRYGADDTAVVNYYYHGDTLDMEHLNGYFNCGGIIAVELSEVGDTLRFYEFNISDDWQYCLCYFTVTATVINVSPGSYVAEVYARDNPVDPIQLVDRQTLVLGN